MTTAPDRIPQLLLQDQVTGIDFIYVFPNQTMLDVYFLRSVTTLASPLPADLTREQIKIYSPQASLPEIEVDAILSWPTVNGQDVLRLRTKSAGDFSLYRFKIDDPRIDPFYNDISFSFKANCPSDLDCKPPDHECPPDELVDFPIDYTARDFWSYRRALLDFAALRYPDWTDRLEADAGIMMAELMSAMGDEMAYYQDRINREAYLETATQRRSIRRHARLIDYHMHDGLGAKTWLDITANAAALFPATSTTIPAGINVFALSDDAGRVDFETGKGITDKTSYTVKVANNAINAYLWDEDAVCLAAGSTEMYIDGHHAADLAFDDFPEGKPPGKWVLLQTDPADAAQPQRAQMVRLIEITDTTDPVFTNNITHLVWEQEQALRFEFDLTVLTVHGNMVPATAGRTHVQYFIADKAPASTLPADGTVNRQGHDNTSVHLFTLPDSQATPLVCLGSDPRRYNVPEILLEEVDYDPVTKSWVSKVIPEVWEYRKALVGIASSAPGSKHFTLDDGTWQRVVHYYRAGKEIEHRDYAMNAGVTIRFGDGEFGRIPGKGTAFRVRYRLGGTRRSNVAARTLTHIAGLIPGIAVTNPLPAGGGWDAETYSELRQLATDAFRAVTYRAVRPEDYAEAAERLPWVQKAGATFRWTGSWLTAFVTPDPKGKVILEDAERQELMDQLNRFRQAGREVNVLNPVYADIDLKIEICVAPDAYPGQVKERVYEALMGINGLRPVPGYFSPDRFTFGTPLDRSTLEAAIQDVAGVRAVETIRFRRRGWFNWREFTGMRYDPGLQTIIRMANDPLHPERGTLKLHTHGGL